eukprot:TRINITY_DN16032_c3_g1_i1.p1 TRINITY_DN16032_c3_g1~~TRINITY_DN16032_c3_g1_i1.p1  ORF type:complete len:456 (-),score=54.66 TRINITY_DN16032_c3_g1_i1:54-1421(-)
MTPFQIARWLLCPVCFILGEWILLWKTEAVISVWPALWSTEGGKGIDEVLPAHPKTRLQAFDLGWQASAYAEHCSGGKSSAKCDEILKKAGDAIEAKQALTPKQLAKLRELLVELENQRSVVDRVYGLFTFVNIIWVTAILGIVCTVGPFLAYLFGRQLTEAARVVFQKVVLPAVETLHEVGGWEWIFYLITYSISVQSARYPAEQQSAAAMVALTGGLLFGPCWMYSTQRHVTGSSKSMDGFLSLTFTLQALNTASLALLHNDSLLGWATILAVYGALGFVFGAFCCGFFVGFESEDATLRAIFASVALVVTFTSLRISGAGVTVLRPFASAAMCMGNVMYFLALLIKCGRFNYYWRNNKGFSYGQMQAAMVGSLLAAMLIGNVYVLPSMANTATVFFVLYLLQKECEVNWGGALIVVIFANFVGLYYIAHYLTTHPQLVSSMFDPTGIYVAEL